jgi:Lipocalin-like domain
MQKQRLLWATITAFTVLAFTGCGKDDPEPTPKTKTELATQNSWKFDKATASGFGDVSASIDPCYKDNIITFSVNGSGNVNESTIICSPSTAGAFTWAFQSNETILSASSSFFAGGSGTFNIISLTETNFVLSQPVTLPPPISITTTVEFTLKH